MQELLTEQRLMTGENAAATIHRLLTVPIPGAQHTDLFVGRQAQYLDQVTAFVRTLQPR